MDLDDTETEDVVFASQVGMEDENDTGSETVCFICRSNLASPPHLISLQDYTQFMDPEDTETGDAAFVTQADAEGGLSTDSETASPTCRSAPTPHLTFPQDDDPIVDPGDTETGNVAFVTQTNMGGECNTDSETASLICRSTPTPHLTSPQDDGQAMALDNTETGATVFETQGDAEGGPGDDSETASLVCRSTSAPNSPPLRMTAVSWISTI